MSKTTIDIPVENIGFYDSDTDKKIRPVFDSEENDEMGKYACITISDFLDACDEITDSIGCSPWTKTDIKSLVDNLMDDEETQNYLICTVLKKMADITGGSVKLQAKATLLGWQELEQYY